MAVVNVAAHGCICASFWMFKKANDNNTEEKPNLKGTKLYLIATAIKYLIVFIFLVLGLIFIIFSWTGAANIAKQNLVKALAQIDPEVIAVAKLAKALVFWGYLLTLIEYLAFSIFVLVYYKAVMAPVDALVKYNEKGTHFWSDLKFLSIILFVTAGLNVVLGLAGALGLLDNICTMMINNGVKIVSLAAGGLGWFSFIARVLFAALCVCFGILVFKGYKVLSSTETSHEEVIELGEASEQPSEVNEEEVETEEPAVEPAQ